MQFNRGNNLIILGVVCLAFVLGNVWSTPYKWMIREYFEKEYGALVFNCDSAMRSHFIASKTLDLNPSTLNVTELEAAEIGLLECHKYDKQRKLLLTLGLDEADLSLISLRYIEANADEILKIVEIHEIRY